MSEHTPGPWRMGVHGYTEPTSHRIYGPNDQVVADTEYSQQGLDDALLIMAAPDLLAACEALLGELLDSDIPCDAPLITCHAHGYEDPCPVGLARAAIAKAKPSIDTPTRHESSEVV